MTTRQHAQTHVLIADNDQRHRESLAEFLTEEGYEVLEASTPAEARQLLRAGNLDVAVLDVRLTDDSDPHDTSGLDVACSVAPNTPKVLITRFDQPEFLQRVLDRLLECHHQNTDINIAGALIDIFPTDAGFRALSRIVQRSHAVGRNMRRLREETQQVLQEVVNNNSELRRQATLNHRLSLILMVTGIVLLAFTIVSTLWLRDLSPLTSVLNALSGFVGLVLEALAGFFYKLTKEANARLEGSQATLKDFLARLLERDEFQ